MNFRAKFVLLSHVLSSPARPKLNENGAPDHANLEPVDIWSLKFAAVAADNDATSEATLQAAILPVGQITLVIEDKETAGQFKEGEIYQLDLSPPSAAAPVGPEKPSAKTDK